MSLIPKVLISRGVCCMKASCFTLKPSLHVPLIARVVLFSSQKSAPYFLTRSVHASLNSYQIELRKSGGDVTPRTKTEKAKEAAKTTSYGLVIVAGVSCIAVVLFYLYWELLSKAGPTKIFSDALEKCREHQELVVALGAPIQGYGETNSRGRRRHVSHLAYVDSHGREAMRMTFYIKGSSGRTGTVQLDSVTVSGTISYRYIIAYLDTYPRRIIIVLDERSELDKDTEGYHDLEVNLVMPVCKFYLQGNCRYGDRCYNEHPRNSGQRQQRNDWNSGGRQSGWRDNNRGYQDRNENWYNRDTGHRDRSYQTSNFSNRNYDRGHKPDRYHWSREENSNNRFATLADDNKSDEVTTMLSTIKADVKTWTESRMWPFSCYCYTKGSGCIDGLPDISPEEMRVLFCLHPEKYQNILSEVEGTYSRAKDELFEMPDSVKSALISRMNISDSSPSENLKISMLYGPEYNFNPQKIDSSRTSFNSVTLPSPFQAQTQPSQFPASSPIGSFQTQSSGQASSFSNNMSNSVFGSPSFQSSSVTPGSSALSNSSTSTKQDISIFGTTPQTSKTVSRFDEIFTPHDCLTDDEKKKFEADKFTIGEIPTRPPSENYCR